METFKSHNSPDVATHPLTGATTPIPTMSSIWVYCVCACGQRRMVLAADWAAETRRVEVGQRRVRH